ncbi:His-Xaa-Ser system radical SAM maturase HxsC [Pigmentiphaga sp. YJ18]|uniref:His-Xaa-Ser system radical SAM maturase HxsC n=1 Tax=Pigmentiphaga sp. YJ18 TaxID=3134907 RepID=UPI003113737C
MLKLRGKISALNVSDAKPRLLKITKNPRLPSPLRKKAALLLHYKDIENLVDDDLEKLFRSSRFSAFFLRGLSKGFAGVGDRLCELSDVYLLPDDYEYLDDGDIVKLNPEDQYLSVVFRNKTPNNSIFLTERCNHLCLMCSQPPRDVDDFWLLDDAFELLKMLPSDTPNIGFTGGEPTIYGDEFIDLIRAAKLNLSQTSVDVLSNGRAFKDFAYARLLGQVEHPNLMLGIPLYSDDPVRHDYIVQAQGAFDETLRGIINLKRVGVRVEIRLVIHKQTLPRMVETCRFIVRNLLFVDHVALMGLEITGYTRANLAALWVDPDSYRNELSDAVEVLRAYGINCSIYNHQLCTVNSDVELVCRKSISDWKNEYLPICQKCSRKSECGGFFSTQIMYRHSEHIKPFNA